MPEKISNSTAVDKALQLYELLLFSHRSYNAVDIAEILGCSKSTVSRLIQQIESRKGLAFRRDHRGGREWYSLDSPRGHAKLSCSMEELDNLRFCVNCSQEKISKQKATEMGNLLDRLKVIFAPNDDGSLIDDAIAPISKTWIDYTSSQKIISTLLGAIQKKRICSITYQKGNMAEKSWEIAPARLLSSSDALYLDGWSMVHFDEKNQPRRITVYIQRIKKVQVLQQTHNFTLPKNEARYFGIMRGEPFPVKVRFIPEVADYVCERNYSDDQQIAFLEDGSVELTFSATSKNEVVSWILGYGASAELLSPEPLRRKILDELELTASIYDEEDGAE